MSEHVAKEQTSSQELSSWADLRTELDKDLRVLQPSDRVRLLMKMIRLKGFDNQNDWLAKARQAFTEVDQTDKLTLFLIILKFLPYKE